MEETTVATARDDGAQQPAEESLSHGSFYRSQQEVDEAFKRRFAAEKEKWQRETEETDSAEGPAQDAPEEDTEPVQEDAPEIPYTPEQRALLGSLREQEAEFPDIDLAAELDAHPMIAYLLSAGYPLRSVYELIYPGIAAERRAEELRNEVIGNLRARNARPEPIGSGGSGGSCAYLTDERVEEIDAQLKRGRRVTL